MGKPYIDKKNGGCIFISMPDTTEGYITYYKCIFQREFAITNGSVDSLTILSRDILPEHWSVGIQNYVSSNNPKKGTIKPWPNCQQHQSKKNGCGCAKVQFDIDDTPTFSLTEIQSTCVGHRLLNSQDLDNFDFPSVKNGQIIKSNEWNSIISILKNQIKLRERSQKYSIIYNNNEKINAKYQHPNKENKLDDAIAPHIEYIDNDEKINNDKKISKKLELDLVLNAIKNLQPNKRLNNGSMNNNFCYDTQPSDDNIEEQLEYNTNLPKMPMVSIKNMKFIIDEIKNDIRDCICYSDCNGYSVCWCYGNCNHY